MLITIYFIGQINNANNDMSHRSFGLYIELVTYTRLVITSSINKVGVY